MLKKLEGEIIVPIWRFTLVKIKLTFIRSFFEKDEHKLLTDYEKKLRAKHRKNVIYGKKKMEELFYKNGGN